MKICTKCENIKSLTEYHKHSTSNDGYQTICKICRNELSKKYHKNNKDKINKKSKEYRQNNKEKIRSSQNNYRIERKKIDPIYKLKNRSIHASS